MKLWLFRFADPAAPLVSARVSAPSRELACAVMGEAMGVFFDPYSRYPADNVFLAYSGEQPAEAPAVVAVAERRAA